MRAIKAPWLAPRLRNRRNELVARYGRAQKVSLQMHRAMAEESIELLRALDTLRRYFQSEALALSNEASEE
jgi:hypothetical protein